MSFSCRVFSDLDVKLSPTGKVVMSVGDILPVEMDTVASDDTKVSWTKVTVDRNA